MAPSVEQEGFGGSPHAPQTVSSSQGGSTPSTSPSELPNSASVTSQSASTASSRSKANSSRATGRSRRGCHTCRKRKVKCSEERPVCGHCRRLQLSCIYEPLAAELHNARSRNDQKQRQDSNLSAQQGFAPWGSFSLSEAKDRGPSGEEFRAVNSSRAQSIGHEADTIRESESSLIGNLMPNISSDISMGGQPSQQLLSRPNTWELELLGEDSLWADIPILSNLISVQDSPPYEYVPSYDIPQSLYLNPSDTSQLPDSVPTSQSEVAPAPVPMLHAPEQISFIPVEEITLLRHFVDFAVPPILVGVEPRWNSSRNTLLRLSKSSLPLRHAICAFAALSLGESPGTNMPSTAQSSNFYFGLAMKELGKLLNEEFLLPTSLESHESILASVFFLSYVEVIVSNVPKSSIVLLDKAHALLSNKAPSNSALYYQLQIWLKLLDAKVVSAGGKGIHLHTNPDTQDLEVFRESRDSSVVNGDQNGSNTHDVSNLETEEILFNSLNRSTYNFYLQVLNFSGRIARLDKWHRSRGSVQDELEVMLAADKIIRDLNALWTRRPAIIDLADQSEQFRQYIAPTLARKLEHHLRTYTANFYACFIHLQRVAYAHLQAIPQVPAAVTKIVHLSKTMEEEGQALPVSMLWPLMMASCEAKDEETQGWIIGLIEGMSKVGNAMRTAKLVKEIVKRQRSGQRADARTVMQEAFGEVFAII